jgi:hypothetical protein
MILFCFDLVEEGVPMVHRAMRFMRQEQAAS